MKILALYGSSRDNGNTERLADLALEGLPCTKIHLRRHDIRPIEDLRHAPGGFQPVDDGYDAIVQQVLEHDVLVFATPLYWYGMSGHMKNFVDRWSQSLRDTRYAFRDEMKKKTAYVVIVGGDNPRLKALPLVQQFQFVFGFFPMAFGGYVIGHAGQPGDIDKDERARFDTTKLNAELRARLQSAPQF
jgi:multimeric flavodoxin WrbA